MSENFLEPQSLGVPCPRCQQELQLKKGRYGLFVGCSDYPKCDYMTSADFDPDTDVSCPECQSGKLVQKTSRYGKSFYACDHYPTCKFSVPLPPVADTCPKCAYALLLRKKTTAGERLICGREGCDYKTEIR
ncbi:DNA topoisomerase 1 [Pseudidiomarina piscicola]|uniref:DNA topoisomerase 1 n=1 Tax=Pseudidiomarina piscicola TaxID=2614830 RepID=A0A6S6WPG5_9GAMM|nr:DNA topoisomerase 1 [Pseudidiomarina piscicola]VZT40325.1 DNA topoisomerase 1 [Pseudomonas aeruginosa]